MSLDWSIGELAAGLNCYKQQEFFDAHEHWENVWRQSHGQEKPFLQALIQVAGAFHHYRRHNLRGCQALLQGAMRRLEPYPERFGGVMLASLKRELALWLDALEKSLATGARVSGSPPDPAGPARSGSPMRLSSACSGGFPESYPKIHLDQPDSPPRDGDRGDSQE